MITPTQDSENATSSEPSVETKTKIGVLVATPMRSFSGFHPQHEAFLAELARLEGLLKLLSYKLPVVGAMYATKEKDCHWCANFLHEVKLQPNGLLQVYELAVGALLTHYEVYEKIEERFAAILYTDRNTGERHQGFFQEVVIERVPYSEDYFFCYLMRNTGIGIFADTNMKLKHRGSDGTLFPSVWPPIPVDEATSSATD